LNNFLRQVENGHRQAVGLVGEPGIGKSRLLAEFRRQVTDGRATWVEGRCLSYGTAIPYLLALDLLRSNCGILETDTPISWPIRSARASARSEWIPTRTGRFYSICWKSGVSQARRRCQIPKRSKARLSKPCGNSR
jgi:ABC-type dipeptide/oligopeptide/nickel transport system ATPase component